MASGSKDAEEEEVTYILLEVTGIIDADTFSKTGNCRILGLMSDNPILQVGNYIFSGEYKETVGTAMFFVEHSNEKTGPSLEYVCKSSRKLALQRAVLKPKKSSSKAEESDSSEVK
ncbi:general transcription factor 3C polypeptide 6-like isoform X2 [Apostichopus japonicus]|uniref:general transcription factor 3C polypeptide 6-like isoform X2 n=1 Tax=Stichopus japonicus TaxID=307972 RepID=UPI003AB6AB7E